MKPIFYDTCSQFIVCWTCGFKTKSSIDMIKHLGLLYNNQEENCVKRLIMFDEIDKK